MSPLLLESTHGGFVDLRSIHIGKARHFGAAPQSFAQSPHDAIPSTFENIPRADDSTQLCKELRVLTF